MEFVRQIIDSDLLDKIELPQSLQNKKVEIIVLPLNYDTDNDSKRNIDSLIGILGKYSNPDLVPYEDTAWADAAVEKHAYS